MKKVDDLPYCTVSLDSTLYNKTGSWRTLRPVYEEKLPPCNNACPSGEKVQHYISLVLKKRYAEAYDALREDNPFPAVCGRVCFHPCEQSCSRRNFDEPLAVHEIERFLGDWGIQHYIPGKPAHPIKSEKVAIAGSGPAGLSCAYHLARMGYGVTIFEAETLPGGMLRIGIPGFRLPKDVLDFEIGLIKALGVKIVTNARIGNSVSFDELEKDYQALFISTGACKPRKLDIPGEEAVFPGLHFLKATNLGQKAAIGKKVLVIGGGNTAIDAARSAKRMGASATVLYRRTREEMPAIPDEVLEAEEEGVGFEFLAVPVRIVLRDGKVHGVICTRMIQGDLDESGRRKPVPVPGSEFVFDAETIITAIGESPDLSFVSNVVPLTAWGGISADKHGRTAGSSLKIFAGGDCVTGPRTVVEAIGAGKKAANAINSYLAQKPLPEEVQQAPLSMNQINLAYFPHIPRKKTKAYDELTLLEEAERCFSCGICNSCDNCRVFCPDMAVIKENGNYRINYDYCKGCGICMKECPRGVISVVEEMQ